MNIGAFLLREDDFSDVDVIPSFQLLFFLHTPCLWAVLLGLVTFHVFLGLDPNSEYYNFHCQKDMRMRNTHAIDVRRNPLLDRRPSGAKKKKNTRRILNSLAE